VDVYEIVVMAELLRKVVAFHVVELVRKLVMVQALAGWIALI
jgi:hypothetical protein